MTGQEMNDEFDLLYDTASEEAPGLNHFEKSMFLTKGMYELTELRFEQYLNSASKGFHDDEINRDLLKGFIASAVVELQATPTISSNRMAAEGEMSAGVQVDPALYKIYKIEPTTTNSYFFQRPADSMGVIYEDVILRPRDIEADVKVTKQLVANVTPIRYDHIDRLMKNPFMKPRHDLAFRLNHSNYDGTSLSEIICDDKYAAFRYRIKYVKRPYPIILVDLFDTYKGEHLTIESKHLPYLEVQYEDKIREVAFKIRSDEYEVVYGEMLSNLVDECKVKATTQYNTDVAKCNSNYAACFDTVDISGCRVSCDSGYTLAMADKTTVGSLAYDYDQTLNGPGGIEETYTACVGSCSGSGCTTNCGNVRLASIKDATVLLNNAYAQAKTDHEKCVQSCYNKSSTYAMCNINRANRLSEAKTALNLAITACDESTVLQDEAKEQALLLVPSIRGYSLKEMLDYVKEITGTNDELTKLVNTYLGLSQATNIDITLHHEIVQRAVELAILHYRENTLQNNMQAKIK